MIRVSSSTATKLLAPKPKPRKAAALGEAYVRLKEADVTKQCVGLMEAHGWKAIRLQRGLMRRRDGSVAMTIGEKGMCDWLFIKSVASAQWAAHARAWFCEFKAPGKKPSDEQLAFMFDCRHRRGLVAEWFDDVEKFREFVRLTFGVR